MGLGATTIILGLVILLGVGTGLFVLQCIVDTILLAHTSHSKTTHIQQVKIHFDAAGQS